MTGERASSEEINQVLALLDIAKSNLPTIFQCFRIFLIRLLVPSFMIWWILQSWECLKVRHLDVPKITLILYTILSLIDIVTRAVTQQRHIKNRVKMLIESFQPTFKEKGLRWNTPQDFPLYIELCRNYREDFFDSRNLDKTQTRIQLSSIRPSQENQPLIRRKSH